MALLLAGLGACSPGWSREAASPSACQAAAATAAIVDARSARDGDPSDLEAQFKLADAWSDAGCFSDALQVLQGAQEAHPGNKELETRLRVARSLVGEEQFFDNLDRADAEARLKRAAFRCGSLADLGACDEALRLKPDDPALLVAAGDALLRARRPADALNRYRIAAVIAPEQRDVAAKIATAESQLPARPGSAGSGAAGPGVAAGREPGAHERATTAVLAATPAPPRRYSNAAPETQSH